MYIWFHPHFWHRALKTLQFTRSVVSNSLWPHGLQHARPPCLSPTHGAYSNSCPPSQWCHPTISSCHPLLLPPSIIPSITVFINESVLHIKWPKYWHFSFSIGPSNEYSGFISFRTDRYPCCPRDSQESSQHYSSKALILQCSVLFIVQFLTSYMTIRKTIALTIQTFVGKEYTV